MGRRAGQVCFLSLCAAGAVATSVAACEQSARDLGYRESDASPIQPAQTDGGVDATENDAATPPAPPPCVDGETRSAPCGLCGARTEVCVGGARWQATTACAGEKDCNAGDNETTTLGCGTPKRKSRSCAAACAWSSWSACVLPSGWRSVASVPMNRVNQSPVASNGRVYLLTSKPGDNSQVGLSAYDPNTDSWSFLGASSGNYWSSGFATPSGVGYVNGDPSTGALTLINGTSGAETVVARPASWPAASTYVRAGWSATTSEIIVWLDGALVAYAPSTSSWRTLAAPPPGFVVPGQRVSLLVVGAKVVVAGPAVTGARLLVLDLPTNAWAAKTHASDRAFSEAFAVDANRVFAKIDYRDQPVGQVGGPLLGVVYSVATGTFSGVASPTASVFPARFGTGGGYASNGAKLFFWSGVSENSLGYESGASFDLASSKWEAMPGGGESVGGYGVESHAWTGTELFVLRSNDTRMRIYRP